MSGYEEELLSYTVDYTISILTSVDPNSYIEPTLNTGPIENIITDEDGNEVVIFSDSTVKDAGSESVQPTPLLSLPESPNIDFLNCTGTISTILTGQQTIILFDVSWHHSDDPSVTHYQVFWVENNVATILNNDLKTIEPRSYAGGPLFSGQSDLLDRDVTRFSFKYPDSIDYVIQKLNVFIFAYNDAGRSVFPSYMISYVLYDKFGVRIDKIYKELTTTTYPVKNEYVAFNILDDSPARYGSEQNILESVMQ